MGRTIIDLIYQVLKENAHVNQGLMTGDTKINVRIVIILVLLAKELDLINVLVASL